MVLIGRCSTRHQPLLLLCLGLLVQQALGSAKAVCSLNVEGFGTKTGLKSAQLSCSGGTVKAVVHPLLLAKLPGLGSRGGIQLSSDSKCKELGASCLITICEGTAVTFPRATVKSVNVTPNLTGLIYAVGPSSVVLDGATFTGNAARALFTVGQHVSVVVKASTFVNNTAASSNLKPRRLGGPLSLNDALGMGLSPAANLGQDFSSA